MYVLLNNAFAELVIWEADKGNSEVIAIAVAPFGAKCLCGGHIRTPRNKTPSRAT